MMGVHHSMGCGMAALSDNGYVRHILGSSARFGAFEDDRHIRPALFQILSVGRDADGHGSFQAMLDGKKEGQNWSLEDMKDIVASK